MVVKSLLIYVHGFLCTNAPPRVAALREYISDHQLDIDLLNPQLPGKPQPAVQLLEEMIASASGKYESVLLIGHSLGGYFATYLATKHNLKAVLINPVIHGYEIMCEYIGPCYSPHFDESFVIDVEDIEYLVGLDVEGIPDKSSFLIFQQMGDEIINQQEVSAYFDGCKMVVEEGGNHDFVNFERQFATLVEFLLGDLSSVEEQG